MCKLHEWRRIKFKARNFSRVGASPARFFHRFRQRPFFSHSIWFIGENTSLVASRNNKVFTKVPRNLLHTKHVESILKSHAWDVDESMFNQHSSVKVLFGLTQLKMIWVVYVVWPTQFIIHSTVIALSIRIFHVRVQHWIRVTLNRSVHNVFERNHAQI